MCSPKFLFKIFPFLVAEKVYAKELNLFFFVVSIWYFSLSKSKLVDLNFVI